MTRITTKLSRLRWFFIIYFAVQLIVDIVLGWDLTQAALGSGRGYRLARLQMSHGAFLLLTLSIAGVLFALGLWLFQQVWRRKNWARVVLLVVGWLTVADALLSWLFTAGRTGLTPWLANLAPGMDWHRVLLVDRIKDFLGLLFWGYLIYVLQINAEVKRDFFKPPQAAGPEMGGPTRRED